MKRFAARLIVLLACGGAAVSLSAQAKRKVIIDQDCSGPAGTDLQSVLVLIQSPGTDVLGITVVSGDQWRDEEIAHTLRLLEILDRTDILVVPGAVFPWINSQAEVARWEKLYGKIAYQGAWNFGKVHGPYEIPPLAEGSPTTKPAHEDAAQFLVRMVHQYPHEITIYAGGPLTNLAIAIALDPEFPKLAKELVVMGGVINPGTKDPEFYGFSRKEFNIWWDAEAARKVLRAPWAKIIVTTVDISIKTKLTRAMIAEIGKSRTPLAQYLAKYSSEGYMWDELAAAAWLDPTLITKKEPMYWDVSLDRGASYGDTLAWLPGKQPGVGEQLVEVQEDVDVDRLNKMFIDLMTRATPGVHP
jgi:inosine-uridine nucleoside N-ribohydrolase